MLKIRTTNKEPINISLLAQILAVLLTHTATIDNSRLLSSLLINLFLQPRPNRSMNLLSLLRRSNLPRPNRPNRLISNHNLTPILNLILNRLQLIRHNFNRLPTLSLFQTLTTTENNTDTSIERSLCLVGDEDVVFLENDATFGVAEKGPGYVRVFELVDGDFTSEGAVGFVEDVLGGDFEAGFEVFAGEEEVEGWWGDDNFCLSRR